MNDPEFQSEAELIRAIQRLGVKHYSDDTFYDPSAQSTYVLIRVPPEQTGPDDDPEEIERKRRRQLGKMYKYMRQQIISGRRPGY